MLWTLSTIALIVLPCLVALAFLICYIKVPVTLSGSEVKRYDYKSYHKKNMSKSQGFCTHMSSSKWAGLGIL